MIRIPDGLRAKYDEWLGGHAVPVGEHGAYRKWLRFYLDFCRKYGHGYAADSSLEPLLTKLTSKGQAEEELANGEQQVSPARIAGWRTVPGEDSLAEGELQEKIGRAHV